MHYLILLLSVLTQQIPVLTVTSPEFTDEGEIPSRYTCDGDDINPPLVIKDIPEGTKSLAIIMEDPDVPLATLNHWVVWNIAPKEMIEAGSVRGIIGSNSLGKNNYLGPCPPGVTHRYFFRVYALNTMLHLDADSGKWDLEDAMNGHILARGEIMGWYHKSE